MVLPIEQYAIIGDCRSAALVSRQGSIDWLCWPRFDSPSLFGALLDPDAGCWRLAPAAPFRSRRSYVDGTNVLQTRFETDTGTLLVTDLMPALSEEEKARLMLPAHALLRRVECERGELELEMLFDPRPGYGAEAVHPRPGALGLRMQTRAGLLTLSMNGAATVGSDGRVRCRERLRAGDCRQLVLTLEDEWPAVLPPLGEWPREMIERSIAWWRRWTSRLTYDGPVREAVVRSALVLKLLVHAPSGAVVAAPTTSLPERPGGDLNWDYRFCWLRDASLTVRALLGLGYVEEAEAFVSWLLHSTRLTQPELRILYDVHGNQPEKERVLDRLSGYRGSRPVRIGNAAADQLQLDVYGEVIDAATQLPRPGRAFDKETQRMLRAFGEYVCRNWQSPDEGIWELRSGRRHHTHSRVLCWTALDRLVGLGGEGSLRGAPLDRFAKNRELIRREVQERSWNPELESYVAHLGGRELDASLLMLGWYGFEPAASTRMKKTYHRIRDELGAGDGLLYRYRHGPPDEGAFGICSFWAAETLALGAGTAEEAGRLLERLCGYANDVGLFGEEIDPASGAALGNFPQAFTHVGLINAALSLSRRLEGRDPLAWHSRAKEAD